MAGCYRQREAREGRSRADCTLVSQALYFDLRKGAHSVGSNVRDSASYVLWALARAHDAALLAPHALALARSLVTVAVYDREISIRRAASAAFQEFVGRTVGVILSAYAIFHFTKILVRHHRASSPTASTSCARQTSTLSACGRTPSSSLHRRQLSTTPFHPTHRTLLYEAHKNHRHPEYRIFLFDHLLDVTLRHWDPSMRRLGSQSLKLLCLLDLDVLGPKAVDKAVSGE